MITHIALFKWKPDVTSDVIEHVMADVRALKEKVEGVLDIRCGQNFSKWNEGYTHAFLVLTKDRKALEAYRKHPDHVEVARRIDAIDGGSIGIDFED
jgi:hypothetical protein